MGDGFMHDSKLPLYLMATLSTVLVLYNFIAVCFRSRPPPDSGGEGEGEGGGGGGGGPSSSAEESSAAANAGAAGHVNVAIISDLIPAHKYSKSLSGNIVGDEDGGGAACAVCLGDFEEGDELRTLPECLHSFHAACIDLWLFKHPNCPICRADQLTH